MLDVVQIAEKTPLVEQWTPSVQMKAAGLGEAGDPGAHRAPLDIIWIGCAEHDVFLGEVWSGSYQAHLTTNDIEELGEFVAALAPQPRTSRECPFLQWTGMHCAKFPQDEASAGLSDAALAEKEGPRALSALQAPDKRHAPRKHECEKQDRNHHVRNALQASATVDLWRPIRIRVIRGNRWFHEVEHAREGRGVGMG